MKIHQGRGPPQTGAPQCQNSQTPVMVANNNFRLTLLSFGVYFIKVLVMDEGRGRSQTETIKGRRKLLKVDKCARISPPGVATNERITLIGNRSSISGSTTYMYREALINVHVCIVCTTCTCPLYCTVQP